MDDRAGVVVHASYGSWKRDVSALLEVWQTPSSPEADWEHWAHSSDSLQVRRLVTDSHSR